MFIFNGKKFARTIKEARLIPCCSGFYRTYSLGVLLYTLDKDPFAFIHPNGVRSVTKGPNGKLFYGYGLTNWDEKYLGLTNKSHYGIMQIAQDAMVKGE